MLRVHELEYVLCSVALLFAVYVCEGLQIHCGSAIAPGFCGPPHYCAPLVCVPDVLVG